MTSPPLNGGNAVSFFSSQGGVVDDLISAQVDPTQPQIQGLSTTSDALVADQWLLARLVNFDSSLYRLTPGSHLMNLLRALLGVSGVGGTRRQQTINRLSSSSLAGTNFLDLDGFWGALFGLPRLAYEQLPQIDGGQVNPSTDAASVEVWDAAASRDGRYRSRIDQLAKAFTYGATYAGVRLAAEAVLGVECDVTESWVWADEQAETATAFASSRTWFAVRSQYQTYAATEGQTWAGLRGGLQYPTNLPLGNRGGVEVTPRRVITEEERMRTAQVLAVLAPASVVVTVRGVGADAVQTLPAVGFVADSTDWGVLSTVDQAQDTLEFDSLYANASDTDAARPALSGYAGESWVYNSQVAHVASYTMVNNTVPNQPVPDFQTVIYADGTSREYAASDAILDPTQAALLRSSDEGVLTSYPYAPGRFS